MMQMRIILNASVDTVKRLRISLGTLVAIEATADSASAAQVAVEAAFRAIALVEHRMHPRAVRSDLAKINGAAVNVPVKVHRTVCDLLNLARRISVLTDGVFDPCLPTQTGHLHDIDVSTDEVICHAPVELDLGGFAKGYAVDCAIETLMGNGCASGLVNAGGDLRVFGPRADPMFVRGPAGQLIHVDINDAALAVSDANSPQRPAEHQGYYVRGRAAEELRLADTTTSFAAVIATEAVIADALAKCVLLCPKPVADRALRAFAATQVLTRQ